MKKITWIRSRYCHWGLHTAFNGMKEYFDSRTFQFRERIVSRQPPLFPPYRFARRSLYQNLPLYQYRISSLAAEAAEFFRLRSSASDILHYLDPEHCLMYLPRWIKSRNRPAVVATFHQPPSILEQMLRPQSLQGVDHIIVVSPVQTGFFSSLNTQAKVHHIPLGVDCDFFHPDIPRPQKKEFICLTGGYWLRDIASLTETASRLEPHIRIRFHFLQPAGAAAPQGKNIHIFSGLSDSQLLQLYRQADLLFLPLTDATANTFLMEGAACGLPILSSDLPGVRGYFPGSEALLVPVNYPDIFAEHILALADDRDRLQVMAAAARERSLAFSWRRIVLQYQNLYECL